jgi:nicotinamidase-related amidase
MNIIEENPALIIIDVQQVLADPALGTLNNPDAEKNILKLLNRWRREKLPLFFVQYISPRRSSPFHEDAPGSKLKDSLKPAPGEILIVKHFESAFMKTDLEQRLREAKLKTLIFTGFYTDQCVASSVKVANNLGFKVVVVSDASATTGCPGFDGTFYEAWDIHNLTLGSLQRDNISIIGTTELSL